MQRHDRIRKSAVACLLSALALMAGCRQDMHNQPKFVPQRGTSFYADGRSARPQVADTVGRGQLNEDTYFQTGLKDPSKADSDANEQDLLPFPVSMAVMERGQERYNIYCTPCHSRVGNGAGMIVQRGYKPAGNFHDAKRLNQKLSHYFYVISNGYGAMPDYSAQLTPADRWAVTAYIRALQLSQNATEKDVPSGAHVESLKDVASEQGYPESYAAPWALPDMTNVHGRPAGYDDNPESGKTPATKMAPAAKPASKPASNSGN